MHERSLTGRYQGEQRARRSPVVRVQDAPPTRTGVRFRPARWGSGSGGIEERVARVFSDQLLDGFHAAIHRNA